MVPSNGYGKRNGFNLLKKIAEISWEPKQSWDYEYRKIEHLVEVLKVQMVFVNVILKCKYKQSRSRFLSGSK